MLEVDSSRYDEHIEKMERAICHYLISASLADHLGDVRDAERYLWKALGFDGNAYSSTWSEMDTDSAYRPTRKLLIDGGYFDLLPDYAQEDPARYDE